MSNCIGLIQVYFGELPSYFGLFINSVVNKPFDLLFFSDNEKPEHLPLNVFWFQTNLGCIKELFDAKLNLDVMLNNPYKLCDYKPSYGLVFSSYIQQYEFWGTIDIDTIVGDFSQFITTERLSNLDVYSGVKEYLSGSFFIFRNNGICNTLFQKSRDWKIVFSCEKHLAFDECGGHYYEQLKSGKSIFEIGTPIQTMTEILFLEERKGLRVLWTDDILEPKGLDSVSIQQQKVEYNKRTYVLLHLIYFKTRYYFYVNQSLKTPYFVNSCGMFKKQPTRFNYVGSKNFLVAFKRKIKNGFVKMGLVK